MVDMTIEQAVSAIIGDELAHDIIIDQGIHWAVVAAMAEAKTTDDSVAIATIRAWVKQQRKAGL